MRLRLPETRLKVTRAVEKKILAQLLSAGFVTSGWCRKHLPVVYDTIRRDLISLIELGIIDTQGEAPVMS